MVIDNLNLGTQSFSQTLSGPTATGFFGLNPMPNREVAFSFTTAVHERSPTGPRRCITPLMFSAPSSTRARDCHRRHSSFGERSPGW